jgi:hypothetical protein
LFPQICFDRECAHFELAAALQNAQIQQATQDMAAQQALMAAQGGGGMFG